MSLDTAERIAVLTVARGFDATRDDLVQLASELDLSTVPTVEMVLPSVLDACPRPSRQLYGRYLRRLVEKSAGARLDEIDGVLLEQWAVEIREEAAMSGRGRGGYSAQEHFLTASRFLFGWAVRRGVLSRNPTTGVRTPRRRNSRRRALTEAELRAVVTTALRTSDDPALDELLFGFVRETAARREGVLNARLSGINPLVGSIVLDEKNDQTREIPISTDLAAALAAHAAGRHPGCDRAFHYRDGTCLTVRRFDSLFRRVQRELPWARNQGVSLHWIRHTTLTDVDRVAGSRVASAYAGHADGNHGVIGVYTKASFAELQAAHAQLFGT